jgi:galactokinase
MTESSFTHFLDLNQHTNNLFHKIYHTKPHKLIRSPGRVNLIGEHTDYNNGFVLPLGLECATYLAFTPRSDQQIQAYSASFDEEVSIRLSAEGNVCSPLPNLKAYPGKNKIHWSD